MRWQAFCSPMHCRDIGFKLLLHGQHKHFAFELYNLDTGKARSFLLSAFTLVRDLLLVKYHVLLAPSMTNSQTVRMSVLLPRADVYIRP